MKDKKGHSIIGTPSLESACFFPRGDTGACEDQRMKQIKRLIDNDLIIHTHSHVQQTCTVDMHSRHAQQTCTVDMHSRHVQWTCTADMYSGHAQQTCTVDVHSGYCQHKYLAQI